MLFPVDRNPSTPPTDHPLRPHDHHSVTTQWLDDLYQRIDEDLADL